VPVLGAFHVVKVAAQAMDEARRHVLQDTLGRRRRAGDPPPAERPTAAPK
jgi:hypothetical protein